MPLADLHGSDRLARAFLLTQLMVTCTTVGYGDLCPTSRLGKLFTIVYALLGMTLVVRALSPLIDVLSAAIDYCEKALTSLLESKRLIPPAVDTLDMSLTVREVNANISYGRRYALALCNPFVILVSGLVLAHWIVDTGDWVDYLYWCVISMTT
jgi:hypothetical protein